MRIGIFDSGLGGLLIAQSVRELMPEYDYVYFGDTLNVPYGNRSKQAVYAHTEKAIHYLMTEQKCTIVIIACNTATAHSARLLQRFYLPRAFPNNRVLGVIIPTLEKCIERNDESIGMIATNSLIESAVYKEELFKLNPNINFHGHPAPLLVPMIENNGLEYIDYVLEDYLKPLIDNNINSLILGCTHYSIIKDKIHKKIGKDIQIISQDVIIPSKLHDYLNRRSEIRNTLTRHGTIKYLVSDITKHYMAMAQNITKTDIQIESIAL